jgi:hypothetical protein
MKDLLSYSILPTSSIITTSAFSFNHSIAGIAIWSNALRSDEFTETEKRGVPEEDLVRKFRWNFKRGV